MKNLYGKEILAAQFIERPNRFVVHLKLDGEIVKAHLPNPGRMWELLFVGITMYIVKHGGLEHKTQYRVIGIERDGIPIMLDTNHSNDVAAYLFEQKQIPGWEEWQVKKREYTVGKSRFDLLLINDRREEFLLEVKSCTLFSENGAMFPDAITERGRKHLLHLKDLSEEGWHTGVLFLVQWEYAKWFLPDYHTDLAFAHTFQEVESFLDWKAVSLKWDGNFTMPIVRGICEYPREIVSREARDEGVYLIVMWLNNRKAICVGSKGEINFDAGYYIYIGSAKKNLDKRIERHKRSRKKYHWHIDYLREHCDVIATLPIRTQSDLECSLASAVQEISEWKVKGFGCSDCDCSSHLFGMRENPIHNKAFMTVVEDFRMNRLISEMNNYTKREK